MSWLSEYPLAVVVAHLDLLPRIQARESMRLSEAAAVGHCTEAGDWVAAQWQAWMRASGTAPKSVKGPIPPGIGIGVRKVKRG